MRITARSFLIAAVSSLIMFAATSSTRAEVINNAAGSAVAIGLGSPFTSVIELNIGGSLCTGALIDSTHVLTAQHCTFGVGTGAMSVNFHQNNDSFADFTIGVSSKVEFDATNNLLDGTDIAILTLASAAPAAFNPMTFWDANLTGVNATSVGFGLNGLGAAGHGGTRDGRRWGVENVVDFYGAARAGGGAAIGGTANIFSTDFDDGSALNNTLGPFSSSTPLVNEGTTAGGDSGGPLLVNIGGNQRITGVLSGGTTATSVYGDISWWTGTTTYRNWIETNAPGAQFFSPVPEPSSALLFGMLSGMALLRNRRRS